MVLLAASQARSQSAADSLGDAVAARQGVGAFNSITDGQPGPPGQLQASVLGAWLGGDGQQGQLGLSVTPGQSPFLRNAVVGLVGPTIDAGEGAVDVERSVTAQWQQRWHVGRRGRPTVATVVGVQAPLADSLDTDVILTAILAQDVGHGVVYANGYVETQRGLTLDGAEVGLVLGVKRPLNDAVDVFADVLVQNDDGSVSWTGELSAEIDLPSGLSLGPGVSLTVASGAAPTPGAGLLIAYIF